ncbi:DUF3986 family protein [Bacillus swezeyi]|uniref:DUF3986 family protein n=1 Tax=Bacillus swezeyi TaxID=1925020 RepID=UPI0027DCB49F|nr:DUF3986 family protein [Bacillus swezeyi]
MNADKQHLHISCNRKGLDLEEAGLKQLDADVWDIYFNFQDHAMNEQDSVYFKNWIEMELNQ